MLSYSRMTRCQGARITVASLKVLAGTLPPCLLALPFLLASLACLVLLIRRAAHGVIGTISLGN